MSPNCRQIVDKLSFVFVCSQGITPILDFQQCQQKGIELVTKPGPKQKSTLLGHYKNLHGPNPKKVKDKACPHCPQVFSSKHALNKHVKSHEAAMELGTSQSVVDVKPPQEFIVITTLTDGQDVAITPAQVIPKNQHSERALSQPCDTSTNLPPPGFSFRPQNTNETKPSNS